MTRLLILHIAMFRLRLARKRSLRCYERAVAAAEVGDLNGMERHLRKGRASNVKIEASFARVDRFAAGGTYLLRETPV